ncbi:hypothetical protein [Anaeromicrobium sediminis]|uniref:NTP pyrophosphohydrolase MazG putative catalytic core domain-containing protein n=1 Tax=Anaeromicrobium sediminis TaxID=1478221 RepID=A0A267MPH3_9FIRM|nr:hypothetical protein [Anaeromicrobium sediminis]PAB61337.1 hypothetical protein CCE28_02585 [Anaeromicrobium sediminis]
MRFIFPVLKSNKLLGLKNNNDLNILRKKLGEEFEELLSAMAYFRFCQNHESDELLEEAAASIILEAMDIIQVSIGIIYGVIAQGFKSIARKKVADHVEKLINKGWCFEKILVVEED